MKKMKEQDYRIDAEDYANAKAKAFHEICRVLNDGRYGTERRIQACVALGQFDLAEINEINQILDGPRPRKTYLGLAG